MDVVSGASTKSSCCCVMSSLNGGEASRGIPTVLLELTSQWGEKAAARGNELANSVARKRRMSTTPGRPNVVVEIVGGERRIGQAERKDPPQF